MYTIARFDIYQEILVNLSKITIFDFIFQKNLYLCRP